MSRYIEIRDCSTCPHQDHKGAFAPVSCEPVCRKANRSLPHTVERSGNSIVARPSHVIPDWCPLPSHQ